MMDEEIISRKELEPYHVDKYVFYETFFELTNNRQLLISDITPFTSIFRADVEREYLEDAVWEVITAGVES